LCSAQAFLLLGSEPTSGFEEKTMVALPVSDRVRPNAFARWFRSLRTKIAGHFEMMGAAIRVGRAVESHQRPSAEDLATLGINGQLPRGW
jgi:hypothetical protein